jgi:F-type H+-transporting ATPase subunit a
MNFNFFRAAGDDPLDHVVQHPLRVLEKDLGFLTPQGVVTWMSDHIAMLILAGILLVSLFPLLVRLSRDRDGIGRLVPRGFATLIEGICEYLREEVARPALGEHTDRFVKYVWSVFFFVLTINLLGLLPIAPVSGLWGTHLGGTATANIWVVGSLSLMTLFMMVFNGLRIGGKAFVWHFLTGGGPWYMIPLMVVVEFIGMVAKIVALTMRLFANMIAGHLLLAVLLSFIFAAGASGGWMMGSAVAVPVVLGSVAIMMLELFVALLQAFIFTFLTTLFIGMTVNVHHDEEHAH